MGKLFWDFYFFVISLVIWFGFFHRRHILLAVVTDHSPCSFHAFNFLTNNFLHFQPFKVIKWLNCNVWASREFRSICLGYFTNGGTSFSDWIFEFFVQVEQLALYTFDHACVLRESKCVRSRFDVIVGRRDAEIEYALSGTAERVSD